MSEVDRKPGKVQTALEVLGKQISELETTATSVMNKTEPCRLSVEGDEDRPCPEARECLSPVANTIMMHCDRVETVTKQLQGVLSELEV